MSATTKSSGLLLGTIIGGAIGAASAFLLAPKTGAKLREDIATKYRTINDKMQQMASTVGEKSHDVASAVGQKSQDLVNSVSQQSTKLADKATEVKDNISDRAMDAKDKFTEKTNQVKDNVVHAWQDSKAEVKREEDSHIQPFASK